MLHERFRYNEMLHSGVDFSDVQEVAAYDSYMQKLRKIEPEVQKMKAIVSLGAEDSVLDIGAGTGEMALGLSKYCKQVFAVDVSKAMIDYAGQKACQRESGSIGFTQAGFLTFNFPPETMDVVLSQFALHHLPDFWKSIALKRIYTVMKAGGRFLLQDCVLPSAIDDYNRYFDDVVRQIEVSGGEKAARDTEKTFRDEFVTLDWIMADLLQKTDFRIVHHECSAPFLHTYLCVK